MRLIPLLLCLASPALAEAPTPDILEETGRIWLRDTLHPAADAGITVPFLSYVQFENGTFEDVFATMAHVIGPETCESIFQCEDALRAAPIFSGDYAVSPDGLALSNITRSPLNFDRAEFALAIAADSFTRGESAPIVSYIDGTLERITPTGRVRYAAAMEEDVDDILGLASVLEVSIAENYDCMVNGHLARAQADAPDEMSKALLALARLGQIGISADAERRTLLRGDTVTMFDLDADEEAALNRVSIADIALRILTSEMLATYTEARATDEAAPLPEVPAADQLVPEGFLDSIAEEAQPALMAKLQDQAVIAQQALPALYAFQNSDAPRHLPLALLCHGR